MARIIEQRMSANIEGDFVVFLIGMRINKPWKIHKWWPVLSAMSKMIKELEANPELGMLGYTSGAKVMVQYWKSFDHLESYARSKSNKHLPAWKAFNSSLANSRGDVGIWHETYKIKSGHYEAVYSGMPAFGLGQASELIPAVGARETARSRITSDETTEP